MFASWNNEVVTISNARFDFTESCDQKVLDKIDFVQLSNLISRAHNRYQIDRCLVKNQAQELIDDYIHKIDSLRGLGEFKVVCDDSNNPPSKSNDITVDIYIALSNPVRVININITKPLNEDISHKLKGWESAVRQHLHREAIEVGQPVCLRERRKSDSGDREVPGLLA